MTSDPSILDDDAIKQLFELANSIPPAPVALWFVDIDDNQAIRFMDALMRAGIETTDVPFDLGLNHIHVIHWSTADNTLDESNKQFYPPFIRHGMRGIWFQMNKGFPLLACLDDAELIRVVEIDVDKQLENWLSPSAMIHLQRTKMYWHFGR